MNYKFNRKYLIILIAISFLVLYFILKSDIKGIIPLLLQANPYWLLGGIICIILYWMLEARTLQLMIKSYDSEFSYRKVLKLVISTQFFNGITPFSTGGQPFQILVLTSKSKLSLSNATSSSIHNFIVYQVALVFIGLLAVIYRFFNNSMSTNNHIIFLALLGFGINMLIVIFLFIIALSPKLTKFLINIFYCIINISPFKKRLPIIKKKCEHTIEEFHKDILIILDNKPTYFKAFLLNFLKLVVLYSVTYFCAKALNIDSITLATSIFANAYVMLVAAITPTPGASGGAEAGFLFFFSHLVSGANILTIMLLWRFITYYFSLIIGAITYYFGYE